jgi:hypothetical protein
MMSMWMSLRMTHCSDRSCPSQRIVPKITPVSVEETWVCCYTCHWKRVAQSPNLDRRLDALEVVGRDGIDSRPLHDLQIAQHSEVQAEVLQRVGRLVDEQYIWEDLREGGTAEHKALPRRMSKPCTLTYASAYIGSEKPARSSA